jgi:hypothetical protein
MKNIRVLLLAAVLTPAAILAGRESALAQESMTFRAIPPDSVAILERSAPRPSIQVPAPGGAANRALRVRLDSAGVSVSAPAVPAPAAVPEPPRPEPLETTSEIVRFGGDIEVPREQAVNGDVVSFGGDIRIDGVVHGSVTALGGDVTLTAGSVVDEDVVCMGGTLREQPGSTVRGRRVTGPRGGPARFWMPMFSVLGTGFQIASHLFRMLLWLGLAFLVVKLAPGRTSRALKTLREEAGMSFMIGLLLIGLIIPSVIVLAIVIAILCITIIGIPLALAVAVGYVAFLIIACLWGAVVGGTQLGSHLFARFKGGTATLVQAALWGVLAIHGLRIAGDLFHVMPIFGFFGGLIHVLFIAGSSVLTVFGAGALVRAEYRRRTVQDWWNRIRGRNGSAREEDMPPPPPPPAPEPPANPMNPMPAPPAPTA